MNPDRWRRIEHLYNAALAIAADERADFLEHECAGDAGLRREVETLLTAHNQAGSFLASPAIEDAAHQFINTGEDQPQPSLIGQSIHQYQIVSAIGKGGMGEVYLAEDTRLHRKVALKLLPAEFSGDPDRVRRFEQEARAVTALNHPNIVTLFDLGRTESDYFMATEFVDGKTLRQYLSEREKLSASEAISIVLQIAQALAAAHEAGIVHRDIKPENIMLRRDGYVKVLDFGLAKIGENLGGQAVVALSSITEAGMVMGTVSYMSPEQARGLRIDGRTDVFSLGVMLYEMLAGQTPFEGTTANDMIASILRSEPDRIADIPEELNCIVMKSLAKERDERHRTVADFSRELKVLLREVEFRERLADSPDGKRWPNLEDKPTVEALPANFVASNGLISSSRPGAWRYLLGATALGLAIFAIWTTWQYFGRQSNYFETEVRPNPTFSPVDGWKVGPEVNRMLIGISSDSNMIAFSLARNGQTDIYVKQLNGGEPRPVTDDPWLDMIPIWSPDNQQIAYLSKRNGKTEVWLIPSLGGPGRMVTSFDNSLWLLTHWSRDSRRIYYEANHNLFTLELSSGESQRLTDFAEDRLAPNDFKLSADEKWIAYEVTDQGRTDIWAMSLADRVPVKLADESGENTGPLWMPDGEQIVYSSKRNGIRQICVADLVRQAHGRKPVQLTFGNENVAPWNVTADGNKIFYVSTNAEADLFLGDLATGGERQLSSDLPLDLFPSFAPDGLTVAYQQIDADVNFFNGTLFSINFGGGQARRLAVNGFDPRWSPIAGRLAFLRNVDGFTEIRTVRSDGADERLAAKGKELIYSFSLHPFDWTQPYNYTWAPDGLSFAYSSKQSGHSNIWSVGVDGIGERMISTNMDAGLQLLSPIWSVDGKRLVYLEQHRAEGEKGAAVFIHEAGRNRPVFRIEASLRMLGWSDSDKEFLVGSTTQAITTFPVDIELLRLSTERDSAKTLAQFQAIYFNSLTLSPDGTKVAYVSRQSGTDEVWVATVVDGKRRKLTRNPDPNTYISTLAWSPKQTHLCFTKQSNSTSIWTIENFK